MKVKNAKSENKTGLKSSNFSIAAVLTCALSFCALSTGVLISPALALSPAFKEGIDAYNQGDYKTANGRLGEALSQDFNNANLHYYMANTFVHLNQREAAVREFRIAYALEPEKEVGKLSKMALKYMGVETSDAAADKPKAPALPAPPKVDPNLQKAMSGLRSQVDRERDLNDRTASEAAGMASKNGADFYSKQRKDLMDALKSLPRGRMSSLSQDTLKQLESMRNQYESMGNRHMENAASRNRELQRTADNLQNLMNDKHKGNKLSPTGTNLYIRNYQSESPSSQSSQGNQNSKTQSSAASKPTQPIMPNAQTKPPAPQAAPVAAQAGTASTTTSTGDKSNSTGDTTGSAAAK